jgi:hypothetical protein
MSTAEGDAAIVAETAAAMVSTVMGSEGLLTGGYAVESVVIQDQSQ